MSRVVHAVAVGAVVGLLLAGCSEEDPRPRMAPTPSPSPSVSESPSVVPTPTEVPEVLGPEETVRAWIEARNAAMTSGDVAAVTALSGADCSSCQDLIDPIAETYDRGGRYETDGWSVLRSKTEDASSGFTSVTAALRLAGGTTYDSAEATPVTYPDERRIAVFELDKLQGSWVVSLIGFLR